MAFSHEELEEIGCNAVRLHAWWHHIAMHHQRLARQKRAASRQMGVHHPVTNYRPQFEEGHDLIQWADALDRTSQAILENLDALVRTTLAPARCTCSREYNQPPPGPHDPRPHTETKNQRRERSTSPMTSRPSPALRRK